LFEEGKPLVVRLRWSGEDEEYGVRRVGADGG